MTLDKYIDVLLKIRELRGGDIKVVLRDYEAIKTDGYLYEAPLPDVSFLNGDCRVMLN